MKKTKLIPVAIAALLSTLNSQLSTSLAQGTAFTYQGLLEVNGSLANGNFDLTFTLFSVSNGAGQVGATVTNSPTAVSNGLFTVTLDFGPGIFTGPARWLEIGSRLSVGGGAFAILADRQELTPAPYAIYAGSAGTATGVVPSAISAPQLNTTGGPSPGQVLSYNGTNLVWTSAGASGSSSNAWLLGGNGGTTSANFVGTTDNRPLYLNVSNAPALRLVPTGDSPQVIGGASVNLVAVGMQGATIGGGGSIATYGPAYPNQIFAYYATIGGGLGNTINSNAYESTIAGGNQNTIALGSFRSTIAGGLLNTASNTTATVGGGAHNIAGYEGATVAGGQGNIASGYYSAVSGGSGCQALNDFATVGGGDGNQASGAESTVPGGSGNVAGGLGSTVSGGEDNSASTDYGTIGGGAGNHALATHAVIAGGYGNVNSGGASAIGGGQLNNVAAGAVNAVISGGYNNHIHATAVTATIAGGSDNTADGFGSFAAGVNAHANDNGSFVWGDGTVSAASIGANTFAVRASGGVGFYVTGGSVNIGADGTLSTKVLTITGGSDVAEPFQMSTLEVPKGAVVVIDDQNAGQLKMSERSYDTRVAGIVSGANGINPGIALHQAGVLDSGQNVALSGRAYVLADASSGPINPGDLLTTSNIPGHAMKVTDHAKAHGAIIGKAMSSLGEGKGMVLVLVTLQ